MSEKRTVIYSDVFPRILKELRKKYRHIDEDVDDFADLLERGETPGDRVQGTAGHVAYKARVTSRDMQRGKSGGFRAIYYLKTETFVIVLTIYAKTEQVDISSAEIVKLINEALASLDDEETDED